MPGTDLSCHGAGERCQDGLWFLDDVVGRCWAVDLVRPDGRLLRYDLFCQSSTWVTSYTVGYGGAISSSVVHVMLCLNFLRQRSFLPNLLHWKKSLSDLDGLLYAPGALHDKSDHLNHPVPSLPTLLLAPVPKLF